MGNFRRFSESVQISKYFLSLLYTLRYGFSEKKESNQPLVYKQKKGHRIKDEENVIKIR